MDFDVDEEFGSDINCPNCGLEYIPADYQFQHCSNCGHVNLNDGDLLRDLKTKIMRKILTIAALAIVLCSCQKFYMFPDHGRTVKPDTIADNGYIKIQLLNPADTLQADNTIIEFEHTASAAYVPGEDAPYFSGFGAVALSSVSADGITLAISNTPYKPGMIIGLNVYARADTHCLLRLQASDKLPASIHVWLKDKLSADSVDLRTGNLAFDISKADTSTYGANRFKIELK